MALTVQLTDGSRIEIPAGAMPALQMQARAIPAADLPSAPAGQVVKVLDIVLFDLQGKPMGPVNMATPIQIHIPLSDEDIRAGNNDPRNFRVEYFDPAQAQWERVSAAADLANKVMEARITHLSLFALVVAQPATEGGIGWLVPTITGIVGAVAAAAILLILKRRGSKAS